MNKAIENRALTTKLKEALKESKGCIVEIRTPIGNAAGQRLQRTLTIAGVKATVVDVVATPNAGVLIETSQQCAKIGLAIQTAFSGVGVEAHLLVQNTRHPEVVVIHLSSKDSGAANP